MSTKFIIAAVTLCGIIFTPANSVQEENNIYLPEPGDDKTNWEALWKATKDNPDVSRSDDSSIFDMILSINAKERGNGEIGRSDEESQETFLFEGDINTKNKNEAIRIIKENAGTSRQRRAIIRNRGRLWRENAIAYAIDGSLRGVESNIKRGIQEWEATLPSCMGGWRDVTRQSRPKDYMYFFRGNGCYSQVGRVGGAQRISIGNGCQQHGVVVHEIGHAMGLWHEQSRPDRDAYVEIFWNNIIPRMRFNFQKHSSNGVDSLGVGYDYGSVMHYGSYAFSSNRRKTIDSKNPSGRRLGQRNGLSPKDKKQVQLLYRSQCSTTPTRKPNPSGCESDLQSARNCQYWKGLGYCETTYVSYMKKNCCKTCISSVTGCNGDVGSARNCQYWKGLGYCERTFVNFMKKNCCKTCNGQ
ncbi:zinc metalloproteinase nas-15-like [Dendronephthya gigantea]|uniref:zinc metalloproteinase nas-15-like n=1 Tax=Dendronephthya gigantea TaxID=151771 RepID=UPI00106D4AEB|nr:zinc metalloproteinase nas-15-like [Dendronephthya gigantea]